MLASADGLHRTGPALVGQTGEQVVHSGSTLNRIIDDLSRITSGSGFDLSRTASRTARILLDDLSAHSSLDAFAHGVGVSSKVGQDVPDGPVG
ncbi:hypothetical protein NOMA109596_01580 [Nocardioides marinus]